MSATAIQGAAGYVTPTRPVVEEGGVARLLPIPIGRFRTLHSPESQLQMEVEN